jgi:hypothetical protein
VIHRRSLLYVLLALAVPLPALALAGGGAASPSLAVGASLDSCGTAADRIVCKLDASWSDVPGATRYMARVTRPDGSVIDYGDVGAGGTSFWVPYVGNGTYTVTVAAYGTKRGSGEPELLAKSSSSAGGKSGATRTATADRGPIAGAEGPAHNPPDGEPNDEPAEPPEPDCEEEPDTEEEPPSEDPAGATGEAPTVDPEVAPEDVSAADEAEDSSELPECPEAGDAGR